MKAVAEAWRGMNAGGFLRYWFAFVAGMLTADLISLLK